jgi:hypothetical protein
MATKALDLYFKDTCLGRITPTGGSFPWNHGILDPSPAASEFRPFFDYIESNVEVESPPYPEEYFRNENWSVVLVEKGVKWEIRVPRWHSDNTIGWSWT